MRLIVLFLGCLVLPALAAEPVLPPPSAEEPVASTMPVPEGAPVRVAPSVTWRTIASDKGRSIEVDTASIQNYAPGKVLANARMVLDKEIVDAKSSSVYKYILTQNRYDCEARSAATLKRSYVDAGGTILREENMPESPDMPMRSNMLEERVMRELCRPLGSRVQSSRAEEAADALRRSNEEIINRQRQSQSARTATVKPGSARKPVAAATPSKKGAVKKTVPAAVQLPSEWDYSGLGGPENWGDIAKENRLCKEGRRQSPIDILDGLEVDLEPVSFDYYPGLFSITDSGRGIEVATSGDMVSLLGKDYYLERLTFRYPAEERINGKMFVMGAHLEHRAADGERLNIAVLLERGEENPAIQMLWDYLPLEKKQTVLPDVEIDLNALLPKERGYHTYMGSMTRPPCEEGVIWVVLQTPVSVSAEQEAILARLYPSLARPTQPIYGRRIKSSRSVGELP